MIISTALLAKLGAGAALGSIGYWFKRRHDKKKADERSEVKEKK